MDYLTQALGLIKLRPLDVKSNKPPFIIGDMPARIIGNQLFLDLMTFLSGFCLMRDFYGTSDTPLSGIVLKTFFFSLYFIPYKTLVNLNRLIIKW